ncbi:MAG: L-glutamine--2-deoxy-scyllo-inosose aminotransferase KanB [Flavobacteriaceae bacterium CG_4_8_14_3_um_filter_34_10]|nr:MAG: L-glutamine--2-deoxy-scyllo-inosose aminotransferase KanB [Flavobacteriaceae bacterium CG2_30_34_30]PIQ18281.1 MAG: L-glutamine--2-deoxy-scyllo-inosose aminotransferase KanB [Flavobacteriaceae bacterium CG18_big_fil_WC_8_21_14_2_50_34_36]PIV48823.1 MAG: L-glutamine--2-deoxy-scyllo-inosose aminotransferase KanB [Flavobacteriaceae bacterium CG02_land_8_20_14_3_00_34_13]PIX08992.1 MAG: L-glutamine--2-deoxy-scyllo-inosose aminotransferase KanB [Flavobacteriaceae bacterium CG_4_8_14_3_um_filt
MPGFEVFGNEERKEVNDVLNSGVLMRYGFDGMRNGHWKAKEFEINFAARMGVQHCQLVSSGTSALTVALAAAGIGAGDEVIIPTFTFVASFESILATGAVPVLVDIDDTLTLSPKAVENAITRKTRCIMPVHMCGSMANLAALKAICVKHNLILLEDACQAIGASYAGKPLGSYGDLGCFSFDFVKTITCGEGGAVITNNKKYFTLADQYQDHGHDHLGSDRGAETHPNLGYNFRISELHAAVGIAQLRKLDAILELQKRNYLIIRKELSKLAEITFRRVPETGVENYSFVNFFLPNAPLAEKAHKALAENGVDACFYWFKNNWHYINGWEHFRNLNSLGRLPSEICSQIKNYNEIDFSNSDAIMGRTISTLVKIGWSEEDVKNRAIKMREAIASVL